ncbi:MAG: hypothetical protein QM820_24195 [Minicystis sp.]
MPPVNVLLRGRPEDGAMADVFAGTEDLIGGGVFSRFDSSGAFFPEDFRNWSMASSWDDEARRARQATPLTRKTGQASLA